MDPRRLEMTVLTPPDMASFSGVPPNLLDRAAYASPPRPRRNRAAGLRRATEGAP